jgi:Flp pilus assembly protein TadG
MRERGKLGMRRLGMLARVPGGASERGGAMITVALSLVVLMGFAALALDGGAAYNDRRTTQNAADNTALAAAWAHCMDMADPIAHGLAVAADNGFDPSQVGIEHESGGEFESQYTARVTSISDTTFARLIGTDEVTVRSEATAACVRSEGGGAFAMFAKGPACQLEKNGTGRITGDSYSAGDMTWKGGGSQTVGSIHTDANLTVDGPLDITGTASATGTAYSNPHNPSIIEGAPLKNLPYPIDFQIDDFRPGTPIALAAGDQYHHHTGTVRASDINSRGPGIHFVEGNVVPLGPKLSASPVTIVATGTIILNNAAFTAYHEGLAVMSGATNPPTCEAVIDLEGSTNIAGLLFAPNGGLEVHGGAVNGGMIAWSIETGGSLELDVDVSLFPGGLPQVFLLR